MTTAQLTAALPNGFDGGAWTINSGVVPPVSFEPTKYRIFVAALGIAIDVVVVAAVIAGAPEVVTAAGTVALVFAVSELIVRPIVGSN
jgi:trimethylamine:corrinoid methyltransferase-like protein